MWFRDGAHRALIPSALLLGLCLQVDAAPPAEAPAPEQLDAVVVTSEKLTVETLIDRKVYAVRSDLQSEFGAVGDILNLIPSVDVDADGVVALRGDTHVLILVDGRPSAQFSGPSAGDNLQSFPASDIDHIEILTTPPAEFKADGAAGVINIVTRRQRRPGLQGSVSASAGSGGRSVLGGDLGYQAGPLAAAVTTSYRQDYRQRLIQSTLRAPDPGGGQPFDSRSTLNETIRRTTPPVGLKLDYRLNDRQSLSLDVSRSGRAGLRNYNEVNSNLGPAGLTLGSAERFSVGHDREIDTDQRLGFSQALERPGESLQLTLHHAVSHENEHYDYTDAALIPPGGTVYDSLGFHEDRGTDELGLDYVLPVSKAQTWKWGLAFEHDTFGYGAAGNRIDPVTGIQTADLNLTDDFRFDQRVDAAYGSFQARRSDWNWLLGLRAEVATTDARRYVRGYPSLHVERTLSEATTLSLGASRRVTRPDPDNLNPYIDYEYTPNLRSGNPNLKPQDTQSYEVSYGYEAHGVSRSVTGYYRRNRDSVTDVVENLGGGLTLATKTNLPRNDAAGFESSLRGHLLTSLAYSLSANLFHSQIDATALGYTGLQATSGVNAKLKLDYRPSGVDSLQFTASRTDRRLTPQGYVAAVNIFNLGFRHQIRPALSLVSTVADIGNGQRQQRFVITPLLTEQYLREVRGRIAYVGLVYTFGSGKKAKPESFDYDP